MYDSRCAGSAWASVEFNHMEPSHTPSAPMLIAAMICWPLAMPPAASTGRGATASTICGHSTSEVTSPV